MIDNDRVLVGTSGKSLFFYIIIKEHFIFVPCLISSANSSCPYTPPNYSIGKMLIHEEFIYIHAKCIVFRMPRDMDVELEPKKVSFRERKKQQDIYRRHGIFLNESVPVFRHLRLPDKMPGSKLVYKNKMNPPLDFGITPNGVFIITLLTDFKVNITDMETEELLTIVHKFVGLRLIVPSCFEFPGYPPLVSVNSRQELLCTDLTRSLSTVYKLTGKTGLLIKARQDEYLHENARFYGVMDDNRSAYCVDFDNGAFSIARLTILKTDFE